MKSLDTLIKLQKTRVDEQQLILTKLQERLAQVEQTIAEIEIYKAREQVAVQEQKDIALTYGAFLKVSVQHGRQLEKMRIAALREVEVARDRLIELFEEQKRYEIARETRIEAEGKEERRRETIQLDESGAVTHQRRKDQ
jgi:flagellar biosynthesis chaperone FliJ